MSEMRLIVAGAGGRMGRALVRVISETPGAVLTGALEAPGSELLGKDAGMLAGLPENADREYAAAFVDFCQMLLNSNEFVYRN